MCCKRNSNVNRHTHPQERYCKKPFHVGVIILTIEAGFKEQAFGIVTCGNPDQGLIRIHVMDIYVKKNEITCNKHQCKAGYKSNVKQQLLAGGKYKFFNFQCDKTLPNIQKI